jgi:hypothetical protein
MGWAARDGMGVKSSSSYYINNRQPNLSPKELELELVREVGPRDGSRAQFVCALHAVSPRDRWSCVLPRWQSYVNVNVNVGPN